MTAFGNWRMTAGMADIRREADAGTLPPQICDCYAVAVVSSLRRPRQKLSRAKSALECANPRIFSCRNLVAKSV